MFPLQPHVGSPAGCPDKSSTSYSALHLNIWAAKQKNPYLILNQAHEVLHETLGQSKTASWKLTSKNEKEMRWFNNSELPLGTLNNRL